MKTKKEIKIEKRKSTLEIIASEGKAYCLKHRKYLLISDIEKHHCYNGYHKTGYCKYLGRFK